MTCGRLYSCDTLLHRWAPALEPMAPALRQLIQKRTPGCASDTSPGLGRWPPPITPTSEMVWCGALHGCRASLPCDRLFHHMLPHVLPGLTDKAGHQVDVIAAFKLHVLQQILRVLAPKGHIEEQPLPFEERQ